MNAPRRLLVVDDEPIVGQSCTRIFSKEGYEVETCTDSREGLDRILQNNNYSAILLDMKMPGMDGIEFLNELRKTHPDIPVMVITGYASIPSAAAAMRLGASDYIPKPFTPDEIVKAVERVFDEHDAGAAIQTQKAVEKKWEDIESREALCEAAPASIPCRIEKAEPGETYFYDESWLQLDPADNENVESRVRVGSLLAGLEEGGIGGIQMPREGDVVYRGLPLASLTLPGGSMRIIPSPISGVVLEVNNLLIDEPELIQNDPFGKGWVARIQPESLKADLWALKNRVIVFSTHQEKSWSDIQSRVESFGSRVQFSKTLNETFETIQSTGADLIFFDAAAYGVSGPGLVRQLIEKFPNVKVAVCNDRDYFQEKSYRMNKILYYSTEPFTGEEIVEILYSAFRPVMQPAADANLSSALPKWISRFQITGPEGRIVTLLAPGEQLARDRGLGWMMNRTLLRSGLPVQADLTSRPKVEAEILDALKNSDQVFILRTVDVGRIPGTFIKKENSEIPGMISVEGKEITTFFVQPDPFKSHGLDFDARTGAALAQFLVYEMISASRQSKAVIDD
ncbi:MAG: response regulator [Candidatus Omnitrophica bacterium]|nr:response regulator [Candidatus Omnitrophota bacterium]